MQLLTPAQVAERLNLKPDTVQRYIRTGRIPGVPVAGDKRKRFRVRLEDLEAYIQNGYNPPAPDPVKPRVARAGFPILERYGY